MEGTRQDVPSVQAVQAGGAMATEEGASSMNPSLGTVDADDARSNTTRPPKKRNTGAGKGKGPLKRKSDALTVAKGKRRRRKMTKFSWTSRPNYTVQHGEDMLLIISNTDHYDSTWKPPKKGGKRRKPVKGNAKSITAKRKKPPSTAAVAVKKTSVNNVELEQKTSHAENGFDQWGQSLPMEVLVNIFQLIVMQDGAIPFLCRVGRVCQLWRGAASSPALWRSVSIGYCWTEPGKSQSPMTEQKIKNTVNWLAQNRFSQLRDFSLSHWKKHVDYVVQVVSESCPQLRSINLSYCTGTIQNAFQSLGSSCQALESINVQYTEFQGDALVTFLETHGSQVKKLLFSHGFKGEQLLSVISRGCCPELRMLEINTKLHSGFCLLAICIQALQICCPKLQIFRLMNITLTPKMLRSIPSSASGFPLLEELCIATPANSALTDQDLSNLLHGSPRLRVLDLRGCSRITPAGLFALPCEELECLYWGLFGNNTTVSSKKGIHMLTQKWSCTLQELDLTNQPFLEEDVEIAMGHLAHGTGADAFRSLNLSGTRITTPSLRLVVGQCPALNYLNLSSCRNLSRGLKRVYRGQEDIHQLLDKLD